MYWIARYMEGTAKLYLLVFAGLRCPATWRKRQRYLPFLYSAVAVGGAVFPFTEEVKAAGIHCLVFMTVAALVQQRRYYIFVLEIYLLIGMADTFFADMVCRVLGWNVWGISENQIWRLVIDSLSLFFIGVFIRIKKRKRPVLVWNKEGVCFYILAGCALLFCLFMPMQSVDVAEMEKTDVFDISGCFFIFLIVQCICFSGILKYMDGENDMREYAEMLRKQREHYENAILCDGDIRKFRHDIKNQLYCLKRLLEKGYISDGVQYLQDIVEEYEGLGIKRETGNYILDIVVEDIIKEADFVILEWNGRFPEKTKMKDTELCVLFTNLLKNAKEEVRGMAEGKITVAVKELNGAVFVTCRNPINSMRECNGGRKREDSGGRGKNDSRERGWGLIKIKEIVKKYGGDVKIEDRGGEYVIKLLLYDILLMDSM